MNSILKAEIIHVNEYNHNHLLINSHTYLFKNHFILSPYYRVW